MVVFPFRLICKMVDLLLDWLVLSANFNTISAISWLERFKQIMSANKKQNLENYVNLYEI